MGRVKRNPDGKNPTPGPGLARVPTEWRDACLPPPSLLGYKNPYRIPKILTGFSPQSQTPPMSKTPPTSAQAMAASLSLADAQAARRQAVSGVIAEIRRIEAAQGATLPALEAIKQTLLKLAARRELFPPASFPRERDAQGYNAIYRLSEDPDHRFALYMSTARPGKKVPPHNHTTWAVIVAVQGNEENFFYERSDDGSQPGRGTLRLTGETVVSPGTGVILMPEDIHHIQVTGTEDTLHLHMYGLALDHLHSRVTYNLDAGTYKVFPANPNIRDAR